MMWDNNGSKYGNGGYLPYTQNLDDGMAQLRALLAQTQSGMPNQMDLQANGDYARQEAARRGIEGPLAMHMATSSHNDFMNRFGQQRFDRMNQLLQLQQQMGLQLSDREAQRRQQLAQQDAIRRQANAKRMQSLFSLGGGVLGGALGSVVPGLGTAVGAGLGSGLGGMAGGFLFDPNAGY